MNRSSFTVTKSGADYIVTDMTGTHGTDTLTNIERLVFADASIALNLAGVAGTDAIGNYNPIVQKFYVAYFGRAADANGLLNMTTQLNAAAPFGSTQAFIDSYSSNATVKTIIDSFGNSAESMALYTGTTADMVTSIYLNVLGRTPLTAGLNYWSNLIDSGIINRGQAALTIMAGAKANTTAQGLIDAALVASRITVAANFTTAMDTPLEADSYRGSTVAASVRSMLGTVNQDTSVFDFQATGEHTGHDCGQCSRRCVDSWSLRVWTGFGAKVHARSCFPPCCAACCLTPRCLPPKPKSGNRSASITVPRVGARPQHW